MIDGTHKVRVRDRLALRVGDRHQRHVAESDIERLEIVQVLPAVKGRHGPVGHRPKQRKMKLVDVEVKNVKFLGVFPHAVEHQHVIRNRVTNIVVETQRHGYARHQMGAGNGVPAGEQRHFVAQSDQLIGEIRDDSLASAIKPRRHALHERRDLRNFHIFLSTRTRSVRNVPCCQKFPAAARRKMKKSVGKFIVYRNSSSCTEIHPSG